MVGGQSEASSGSSVSIGDPQVKALLEMLAQGGVVTKPTMGLSEAQRFHGEHYSTWRLKFIRKAKEVGLWEYYRPDEKGDEAERAAKSEEENMEFKKRSKLAFFQLCHSVADGIVPNQKIIDYVNMARSYNDDLTAMGEPETERAMIGHIVNGLPEDWSVATPTAAENGKEDAILGGAHKANVAHASEVCMLAKGGGAAAWFMDSGCTQHMTNHCEWLTGMRESSVPYVILGNEGKLPVKGEGELVLQGQYGELKLENVPYVDGLALNLISQSQLESTGCKTFSDKGKMWVFDHAWNVIAEGMRNDGLYEMKLNEKVLAAEKATYQPPPKEGVMARKELKAKLKGVPVEELQVEAVAMVAAAAKVDLETLHRHLGHAGMERIKELVKKSMAAGVELKEGDGSKGRCGKCVEGKISKTPHPIHQVQEPYGAMEIVAADVCGPFISKMLNRLLTVVAIFRISQTLGRGCKLLSTG
ncbi:unnamed protein product [Closterium sp. NIES-53]